VREHDEALERWLREEVAPAAEAVQADPSSAISLDEVMRGLRELHAEHVKAARKQRKGPVGK